MTSEQQLQLNRFACQICGRRFLINSTLKYHRQAEHEGVKFSCNQCDYVAKRIQNLNRHKKLMHDGISLQCDK